MSKYVNTQIVNQEVLDKTIELCKQRNIILPTFDQLAHPEKVPPKIVEKLKTIGLWDVDPLNLFRISWHNDIKTGGYGKVNAIEIPTVLSGVKAPIYVLIGKRFPTGCHKVGATYGPLVSRLIRGDFDPTAQKALWPSTGNYCRGGAFNSRLLGCTAIAVLPEQMSQERFNWLKEIGAEVYATPGCESNVKEIFDKAGALTKEGAGKVVNLNQFEEFANPIFHYHVTGPAMEEVFNDHKKEGSRLAGVCLNQGSAGTLASGMYLHKKYPHMKLGCSEALQCPTLLVNGFGDHRIEGIGDKHVPWVLNAKDQDVVLGIDDEACMQMLRVFNTPEGKKVLKEHGVTDELIEDLANLGISGIANILGCIKMAKYFEFTEKDMMFTVATDSAVMYQSRLKELEEKHGKYTECQAYADWFRYILGASTDHVEELTYATRKRIHNLKYYTWIEQQGKTLEELNAQWYCDCYWDAQMNAAIEYDKLIVAFNEKTGLLKQYE
ncbi:Pyridoxal-phosphate dependent enzyme family protein [Trichomonas vaginalis G3]|uniref:Pyridoxal-phosphate dependent enzyme family protein n=1 Tax=Trichomonas vaginalis (strain ATCC PRA-98 / G3) TaxID=412133 RepID=A2D811_TRIV3|nr:cysteine biosynthetic process from serine [Trichomonas vaginalis G3]EAY23444.1 Pyridoxal-phosphate dependent enzyme family protein [Trichomonas vaginalis G3]KAI5493857.1 cysteine biosynthetic process from serine [Trichomonas vaginalis G3]|eukprot:XP_001584430.1 Pyridoxal-phosphate dependent enzyme family protein [Trichomonas vaginalis G3]